MVQAVTEDNSMVHLRLPPVQVLLQSVCTCSHAILRTADRPDVQRSDCPQFVESSPCTAKAECCQPCAFHHPYPERCRRQVHCNAPEEWSTLSHIQQFQSPSELSEDASSLQAGRMFLNDKYSTSLTPRNDCLRPYKCGWFDPNSFIGQKVVRALQNYSAEALRECFFSQTMPTKYGTNFKAAQHPSRSPSSDPHSTTERERRNRHRRLNGIAHACAPDFLRKLVIDLLPLVKDEMHTELAGDNEGHNNSPLDRSPESAPRLGASRSANSDAIGKDEQYLESACFPYFAAVVIESGIKRSDELERRLRCCICGSSTATATAASPMLPESMPPTSLKRSFETSNLSSTYDMHGYAQTAFGSHYEPRKRHFDSEAVHQSGTQIKCKL